jgi:hypothetical protein
MVCMALSGWSDRAAAGYDPQIDRLVDHEKMNVLTGSPVIGYSAHGLLSPGVH